MDLPHAIPYEKTFDAQIGLEMLEVTPELARARLKIHDGVKQPMGLLHGGVIAAVAESITSVATFQGVIADGMSSQGLSNQTSFLRPVFGEWLYAEARRRHKGRTTWVWEVDITDDQQRLCALVRMTIAVRPLPEGFAAPGR